MKNTHTLLIIDNEPFNLNILQGRLIERGFDVVRVADGAQALGVLDENLVEFSAVLFDRMMPGEDGLDVLRQIKKRDVCKNLPVFIQSAATTDKDVIEGIEAGAFYYLTKPFDPELMVTIVNSAITDRENLQAAAAKNKEPKDWIFSLVQSIKLEFKSVRDAKNIATRISTIFPDQEKAQFGLTELFVNAVEHGNLGITYEEKSDLLMNDTWHDEIEKRLNDDKYKKRFASVELKKLKNEIALIVKDQGSGFNWKGFLEMSADRASHLHGRGIALASMISFDSLEYVGNGNEVRCTVKLI